MQGEQRTGENLLTFFKNCSMNNKLKFSSFLQELLIQDNKEESQLLGKLEAIFIKNTKEFSVSKIRDISKNERNKKDLTNFQYNYGEISFKTVFQIISKIKKQKPLQKSQIFYDLGSGSGKVLFAASLCHSFIKCKGIQYLQSLYETSLQLKKQIEQKSEQIQTEVSQAIKEDYNKPTLELYNENFEKMNWSDGTVIFVSSTCYTRQVMNKIELLCHKLSPGTILITLTQQLETFIEISRLDVMGTLYCFHTYPKQLIQLT